MKQEPRRALISVSDKKGMGNFATGLHGLGFEIISTGGTFRSLAEANVPAIPVETVTGQDEVMDGRVKTLHPAVHGAILAVRDNPEHMEVLTKSGWVPIEIVVVNLYPFSSVVSKGCSLEEAIENIDIGGPSMIRSAAKNHEFVTVVTDPEDYGDVLCEMEANGGNTTLATRRQLAFKAFRTTANFDLEVWRYLGKEYGLMNPQ